MERYQQLAIASAQLHSSCASAVLVAGVAPSGAVIIKSREERKKSYAHGATYNWSLARQHSHVVK
jgi:lipid-binding SYLF domain-containing protein